jgi:hypothetical protein
MLVLVQVGRRKEPEVLTLTGTEKWVGAIEEGFVLAATLRL